MSYNPDDIPIDIQCNKLVDWLISRRHCNIKWQQSAEVVKGKIAEALKDMPGTKEMKDLLQGSCFHYYKCRKIVDVLKDTEKDSKNIFGRYSSQRMKDWQEILKLYEKENLHMAELASRLLRNVNYEIPDTKKQIAKCSQIQQECDKKMADCERNKSDALKKYKLECEKIGIVGVNLYNELSQLATQIPDEFDQISSSCKALYPIVEYYQAFVNFTVGSDDFNDDICPVSKHISQHGNTTVYQWRHDGVVPDKIIKQTTQQHIKEEAPQIDGEIDWGLMDDVTGVDDDVINFDIEVEDCGIEVQEDSANNNGSGGSNNGFEIVSVDELSQAAQHSDASYNVAQGVEALSMLENFDTRTTFINELIELRAFLRQRLDELSSGGDTTTVMHQQLDSSVLQLTSGDEVTSMLTQVDDIHDRLMSTRTVYLCRILDSPKFVERLANQLKLQLSLTNKYEHNKMMQQMRQDEALIEEKNLYPKLNLLVDETKEWRKLIENEISKLYKNRQINLMGSINFL